MTEHVVVLHGLGLNKYWVWGLARHLARQGYAVQNKSYPSRRLSFEQIIDDVLAPLVGSLPPGRVHFAGHSMGGILVRLYAQKYGTSRIGRVVMLGTPNHGSEVADFFRDWRLYRFHFGPAGQDLGTGGIATRLPAVPFDCGVIAGDNRWLHVPSSLLVRKLPVPNDGIVSVASTRVEGMKDHLTVWADHSMMVWHPEVWRQTAAFLKTGAFTRP